MQKRDRAEKEAQSYLELQRTNRAKWRTAEALTVIFFALALILTPIAIFVLPQEEYSENENRYLTVSGGISFLRELQRGVLGDRLAELVRDQFPARRALIELKAASELLFLRWENNGVLYGRDGALIARLEYSADEKSTITENLLSIESFASRMEDLGIDVTFALAPRGVDVLSDSLPALFSDERTSGVYELFRGTEHISLLDALSSRADEYVWYRTDHHWTALGAYYAYCALARSLGFEPAELSELSRECLSLEFYGTSYSKSGFYGVPSDKIEAFRYSGDQDLSVTDGERGELLLSGLYDHTRLDTKDKYSVYLGGDRGHILISGGEKRPRLLVIKDSFFNSLAPFLALHFELDMIDLRYFAASPVKYAESCGADRILILCGVDSLASAKTFLSLGGK